MMGICSLVTAGKYIFSLWVVFTTYMQLFIPPVANPGNKGGSDHAMWEGGDLHDAVASVLEDVARDRPLFPKIYLLKMKLLCSLPCFGD